MEEKTADEIAAIYSAAGDSVTVINAGKTEDEKRPSGINARKNRVVHEETEPGPSHGHRCLDLGGEELRRG